tara:strand:+ start:157 stop:348 length:192 start_codon:yes stop_codon:yes gene_type:complete
MILLAPLILALGLPVQVDLVDAEISMEEVVNIEQKIINGCLIHPILSMRVIAGKSQRKKRLSA